MNWDLMCSVQRKGRREGGEGRARNVIPATVRPSRRRAVIGKCQRRVEVNFLSTCYLGQSWQWQCRQSYKAQSSELDQLALISSLSYIYSRYLDLLSIHNTNLYVFVVPLKKKKTLNTYIISPRRSSNFES